MPIRFTLTAILLLVLTSTPAPAADAGPGKAETIMGSVGKALSDNAEAFAAGAVGLAVSSQALSSGVIDPYPDFITIIANIGEETGSAIDDSGHGHGSGHGQ